MPAPAVTQAPVADVKYDPLGEDRNCGDFSRWDEAQAFYEAAGGPAADPHRLDRDGSGVACRSLPGAPQSKQALGRAFPGPQSPASSEGNVFEAPRSSSRERKIRDRAART